MWFDVCSYESDIDEFKLRVRDCIERCLGSIYEEDTTGVMGVGAGSGSSTDDPLAIKFTKMDEITLKQAKDAMTTFRVTYFTQLSSLIKLSIKNDTM